MHTYIHTHKHIYVYIYIYTHTRYLSARPATSRSTTSSRRSNPQRFTPNPKPQISNPKPSTQNHKHDNETRNTKHKTQNTKHDTRNTKRETRKQVQLMATNCKLYCQTRDPGLVSAAYELVQVCTTKYKVVVQSTLLTSRPNRFTRALRPRSSRDPLRLAEGGALPYEGAGHCPGFSLGKLYRQTRDLGLVSAAYELVQVCSDVQR